MKEFHDNPNLANFSRIPVYYEQKEYICGYVLKAAVLEKICSDNMNEPVSGIIRPILFFSENDKVSDIWKALIEKKEHISVITDEYGCMRGIVTMEDVIETMLGVEIIDECDIAPDLQAVAREKYSKYVQSRKPI